MSSHGHYHKGVSHLQTIDIYRVIELFEVPAGALDHAAKKILCAGGRGAKDIAQDVQEAIDSLVRWQRMRAEDAEVVPFQTEKPPTGSTLFGGAIPPKTHMVRGKITEVMCNDQVGVEYVLPRYTGEGGVLLKIPKSGRAEGEA